MTKPKTKTTEVPEPAAALILPDALQLLSIEEIATAVGTHLEGHFHAYRHRFAEDFKHQQVQLETFHETKSGQKFRVMTEYHEAFTVVDLVEDLVDKSNTH